MFKRFPSLFVAASILLIFSGLWFGLAQAQEEEQWTRAIPISSSLSGSWYPSLVAEDNGTVHAVWGVTQSDNTLYYSKYDGLAWTRPVDILFGGPRSVMVTDGRKLLHLMYPDGASVVVTDAPVEQADTSQGWNSPLQLNKNQSGTMGSLVADPQGVLHSIWVESKEGTDETFQIAYGQSTDSGHTWSLYRVVSDAGVLTRPTQLVRAPSGTLFAMWSAGSGEGRPDGVALSKSTNDGETWLDEPIVLRDDKEAIRQPLLDIDAKGNLILIENFGVKDETFYQISSDQGATWSERKPIPGLFAARTATGNDYFGSAHDSSGVMHLIAVGRANKTQDLSAVYHLKWDGETWSAPATVYQGDQFIELPALAISNGNRLHVAFSTRDRYRISGDPDATYQIWYTSLLTDAPEATQVSLPTLTRTPTATATVTPTGTPTRRPTITPGAVGASTPDSSEDSTNTQLPIVVAVVPVLALLGLVVLVNLILRRRR